MQRRTGVQIKAKTAPGLFATMHVVPGRRKRKIRNKLHKVPAGASSQEISDSQQEAAYGLPKCRTQDREGHRETEEKKK